MKPKKVNKYRESAGMLAPVLGIILVTPILLFLKNTVISTVTLLMIVLCGGIAGFIFTGNKVNSFKTFRYTLFMNLLAWGPLCCFLFTGANYCFSTKDIRQHTFPISNRYLTKGKNAAAIVEVANTNFDYSFRFKKHEMDYVNQADSIAVTFREGLLGYIIIREYHLISNP